MAPDKKMAPDEKGSEGILDSLHDLFPRKIDLSLGRMHRLLARLGHPETRLPPVFHIAGTNGKGSTAAFLTAIAQAAGLKVHLYTSPHLLRFHERIQLAGPQGRKPVGESVLADLLLRARAANDGAPITYFEITTAAAFLGFAEHEADLLVLETGLGGRLDATNVVKKPHAALLSPIAFDHQDYLGTRLPAIAREKGGIIKPGSQVVSVRQRPAAAREIAALARAAKSRLFLQGRDWDIAQSPAGLCYEDEQGRLDLPRPRLAGLFQHQNAGLAIAALRAQPPGSPIQADKFATGLKRAYWPARMERIAAGALARAAGPHEIWLDGGHNPHAAQALAESFAALPDKKPLFVLCAMQANKDSAGFFRPFRQAQGLIAVPISASSQLHPPEALARQARALGLSAQTAPNLDAAVSHIRRHAPEPSRILLCGTLNMAAQPQLAGA